MSDDSDGITHVPIAVLCPAQHGGEAANLWQDQHTRTLTKLYWQIFASIRFWFWRKLLILWKFYIFCNLYSFLIAPRFLRFLERKLAPDSGQHSGNCQEKGMWYGSPWCATIRSAHPATTNSAGFHTISGYKERATLCALNLNYLRYVWSDPKRHKQARKMSKPSFPLLSTMLSTNLVGCCTTADKTLKLHFLRANSDLCICTLRPKNAAANFHLHVPMSWPTANMSVQRKKLSSSSNECQHAETKALATRFFCAFTFVSGGGSLVQKGEVHTSRRVSQKNKPDKRWNYMAEGPHHRKTQ